MLENNPDVLKFFGVKQTGLHSQSVGTEVMHSLQRSIEEQFDDTVRDIDSDIN